MKYFVAGAAALFGLGQAACSADRCTTDDGRSLGHDYAQTCYYHAQNEELKAAKTKVRAVFLGDSITEGWQTYVPEFFTGGIVDRGISGQTSDQMLGRFDVDVLALKPDIVHVMAGTNDIAGNDGAATLDIVTRNIAAMAERARANAIRVVIGSVPPARVIPWNINVKPAPRIVELNRRLAAYAHENGFAFVDYHSALADADGGMKLGMAGDGVHPSKEGFLVMTPLARAALSKR